MRKLTVVLLLFVLPAVSRAQFQPDSLWQKANSAIAKENYEFATRTYETILGQGFEHEDLYYNLGNAYYRSGDLGLAIWAYEKGLQFAPRNPDLKYNLAVAKTRIVDRIDVPEGFILLELYAAFKNAYTVQGLLLYGAVLVLLAAGIFFLTRMVPVNRKWSRYVFTPVVILAVLFHLIALDKFWSISGTEQGVIIAMETEAHSTPSGLGKIIFRVHEGLKVEITQISDDWIEIVLLDGKKGWVYSGTLRML